MGSKTDRRRPVLPRLASGTFATGRVLPAGSETITGAGAPRPGRPRRDRARSAAYVDQEMASRSGCTSPADCDLDDNSAFGEELRRHGYPRPVSPGSSRRSRLRAGSTPCGCAAPTASTQQPGTTDALRFFPAAVAEGRGGSGSGVTFANLGNTNLKPERSLEIEVGFDAALFDGRVVSRPRILKEHQGRADGAQRGPVHRRHRVPSSSTSARSRTTGFEVAIDTRIIDSRNVAWDRPGRLGLRQRAGRAG